MIGLMMIVGLDKQKVYGKEVGEIKLNNQD